MKKILLAALAFTMLFASCSKEEGNTKEAEELTTLTVRIAELQTKTVEAPGETGQIALNSARIFIMNPAGTKMLYNQPLTVADALSAAGEQIPGEYPADARVYIIGNMPADINVANLTTLARINEAVSAISSQTSYKTVALANSTGQPATITVIAKGQAIANIALKPLISRMELAKIQTAPYTDAVAGVEYVITAYKVEGVYIDSYYSGFHLNGTPDGVTYEQYTSTDFTGVTGDNTGWNAIGTPRTVVPGTDLVWAHQVVSGGLPRFIIHLTGVSYTMDDGIAAPTSHTIADDRYVTVAGYKGLTQFERGKIYRVGGTDGITFTYEDIAITPNPENLTLTVYVTIEDWVLEDVEAIL